MSSDWLDLSLGECLAKVVDNRGKTPPISETVTPNPLIEVNAIVGQDKFPNFDLIKKYVSEDTYNSWFRAGHPMPGDVIFSTVGSIAEIALFPGGNGCIAQNLVGLRPKTDVLTSEFLYYSLANPAMQTRLRTLDISSVQPSIKVPHLLATRLRLPALSEQRALVATLSALDDRITLLRETNTTLEAIAQALFKSWFVDFDPVHAKMQGRAPEGMDEATAALFPDSFEDSELGSVPKGWKVGALDTLAQLNPESWSTKNHPEWIHYVDLANTKAGQIEDMNEFNFDEAPSRARRVLRCGDVIVGTVRPGNRSFARISVDIPGLTGSTGFAVLRPRQDFDQALAYIAATCDEAIDRLSHLADGGAYPAVRPEVVGSTPLVIAPELIRKAFGEITNTLYENVGGNQELMKHLATLRDTLLPRLISGQLRVDQMAEVAASWRIDGYGLMVLPKEKGLNPATQ